MICRKLAHEGGKFASPMHWLPLPIRRYPYYSFLLEAELTPGPQCHQKEGIAPGLFKDKTRILFSCSPKNCYCNEASYVGKYGSRVAL
jgi:hypothetical protein